MEYAGCKKLTFDLIEEASEKFGDVYILNEEKYGRIDTVCNLVDNLVCEIGEEFGCREVSVDVDTAAKELIFRIVCDEIVLQNKLASTFFILMGLMDFLRFSKAGSDGLKIETGVSGLWIGGHVYE